MAKLVVEDQDGCVRDKLRIRWNIGRSWGSRSQEARGDLGGGRVCWCKQWKMRQGEQRVVQRVVEVNEFWDLDDREQRDRTGRSGGLEEHGYPKSAKDASQTRLAILQRRRIGKPWCLNLKKTQRSQTYRLCWKYVRKTWRSRWWWGKTRSARTSRTSRRRWRHTRPTRPNKHEEDGKRCSFWWR